MARPHPGVNWPRLTAWSALSLIIGASLNVAVAWALVWLQPLPVGRSAGTARTLYAPVNALALPADVPRPDKFFTSHTIAETYWQMLWDEPGPYGKDAWPATRTIVAHLVRLGWPARSLQYQEVYDARNNGRNVKQITSRDFAEWRASIDLGIMRYGAFPVWPGFIINTLFFAALVGTSLWGLATLRARRRTRAGHCPACDYDRHGLPETTPCPECGGSSPLRPSETNPKRKRGPP